MRMVRHRPGSDERLRTRLRQAGRRFRAAEIEKQAAVAELKQVVLDADGRCSAAQAADLTGMSTLLLEVLQPELGRDRRS